MLVIKKDGGGWATWHLGGPIPEAAEDRVVTMQLDGDELNLVLRAMEATRKPVHCIIYTKMKGFRISEFCSYCGAGIGKHRRDGEGTCPECESL